MGLLRLQKRPERLSPLPPREATARRLLSVNQEEGFHQTESAGALLDLGRPASRTVRNNCLLSIPCPVRSIFVVAARMKNKSLAQDKNLGWIFSLGNHQIKESMKIW